MGGPKGRAQRAGEPAGRSGSGGPEPEAYLKRSDREEPASSGSPRGMPRGAGAGGEISRTAMVSQGRGRPRSCARGAGNGAGHGGGDDDHSAGSSRAMEGGVDGADTATHYCATVQTLARRYHRHSRRWPRTTGQAFGFGAEGDSGRDPVDDRPPPAAALRRTRTERRCAAGPGACRVRTRQRHHPAHARKARSCRQKCGAGTARGGRRRSGGGQAAGVSGVPPWISPAARHTGRRTGRSIGAPTCSH